MGVNKKVMRLAGIGSTFGRPEANFVHAQAGSSAQKVLLPEAEEPETRKRAPTASFVGGNMPIHMDIVAVAPSIFHAGARKISEDASPRPPPTDLTAAVWRSCCKSA